MSGSNLCNERNITTTTTTRNDASPSTVTTAKNNNNNKQNSSNNKCKNNGSKQISFIKRFNPFGSSSSTHTSCSSLKGKIDDIKQQTNTTNNNIYRDKTSVSANKNSEFRKSNEYRDVKSLKQFWNNHILSSNDPSKSKAIIKQKSATLNGNISAKCLEEFSDENYNKRRTENTVKEKKLPETVSLKSRASSVPSLNIFKLRSPEKSSGVKLKSYNSIDNFDKYKSAETVKNRRYSKEESSHEIKSPVVPNFPLVTATSGGTKIHWAKRDDLIFGKASRSSFSKEETSQGNDDKMIIQSEAVTSVSVEGGVANKRYDETPSRKGSDIMVSDMVDMVVSESVTKTKLSGKSSVEGHQKVIRKISFRTTKNATPTNSYSRRLNKHQENSSRVAALTLRFNEMVQQDASLLKEVKKNGGIVHKVGGHVYKIVEEEAGKNKRGRDSNDDASSVSSKQSRKKASVRRKASMKSLSGRQGGTREKSVKETIQLFEPSKAEKTTEENNVNAQTKNWVKPKVPDKSETVKLRSQVLRLQKQVSAVSDGRPDTVPEKTAPEFIAAFPDSSTTDELESKDDTAVPNVSHVRHYLKRESDHKSKYSRMYEKMKFRSLFTTSTNKRPTNDCHEEDLPSSSPDNNDFEANSVHKKDAPLVSDVQVETPVLMTIENSETPVQEPVSPDYKPNTSFLFRNATLPKNTYCSTNDIQSSLVEAINAALINKTRSMDENSFPHSGDAKEAPDENDFHLYTKNKSTLHEKNRLLSTIKVAENSTEAINEMCHEETSTRIVIKDEYEYIGKGNETGDDKDQGLSKEATSDDIYQSLAEANGVVVKEQKRESVDSFEESYESVEDYQQSFKVSNGTDSNNQSNTTEDGYELCDPPEPPPPRKPSVIKNDLDPLAIPVPKRVIHTIINDTYEHVKYTDIPPRPPSKYDANSYSDNKQEPDIVPLPPRNGTTPVTVSNLESNPDPDDHDYYEENIYDTIKHADNQSLLSSCYEAIQQRSKMNGDTASLLYDSVKNEFNRFHFLQHADSTLTLASDQKTNSIYGTTIMGQSITPPSERGSDHSDEWVDISDDEGNNPHKFVM